jgi:predicted DNA-binding ArsR family transcriptional regulator
VRPRNWPTFPVGDFGDALSLTRGYWGATPGIVLTLSHLRRLDGENFEISLSQMAKIVFKSTMVGENFEIYLSQMAKIVFKFTMVGENFEIYLSQMVKIVFKSTMVGENFEIYLSQMAKIVFKSTIGVIGVNDLSFTPL